ncbi:MAG: hypothetical protein Kow00107_05370 [Planctomycetota bacterium]
MVTGIGAHRTAKPYEFCFDRRFKFMSRYTETGRVHLFPVLNNLKHCEVKE